MFILRKTVFQVLKTFLFSILCSVPFYFMIYRPNIIRVVEACFILNGTALALFFYLNHRSWGKLYLATFNATEYFVPTLVSIFLYTLASLYLYILKSPLYMLIFLPTRFMEPLLNPNFAWVSFLCSQLAFLGVVFVTPPIVASKL